MTFTSRRRLPCHILHLHITSQEIHQIHSMFSITHHPRVFTIGPHQVNFLPRRFSSFSSKPLTKLVKAPIILVFKFPLLLLSLACNMRLKSPTINHLSCTKLWLFLNSCRNSSLALPPCGPYIALQSTKRLVNVLMATVPRPNALYIQIA